MSRIILIVLVFISICSASYAADVAKVAPETVAELMLFYDWDELVTTASKRSQKNQ